MKFNDFDVVKTLVGFPEEGIAKGEIGAVIESYKNQNVDYLVEFVNEDGTTKAMFYISCDNLEKVEEN